MDSLLELALEVLAQIAGALLPGRVEKFEEWRHSDSLTLRVVALLILSALVALIGFLIYWLFPRK